MIVEAIELKKRITLQSPSNDIINKEPLYTGNPGDFLVTTSNGNQAIIPKAVYEDLQAFGVAPRTVNFEPFIAKLENTIK